MLEIKNITKIFNAGTVNEKVALHDLSLTLEDGDFVTNILPIIIAVVILLLLGFMVWRSLRPIEVNEVEPELSVEELLSATRDKQAPVEDIDLEEKSETRKAIEKFVDENPEAAALLLRNWLNDDWE